MVIRIFVGYVRMLTVWCRMIKAINELERIRKEVQACQSALQPWVSFGLLYNQSPPGVRFLKKIIFYRMGLLALCATPPPPGGSGSLVVWTLPFDLTGMGGSAGS
jgi:hypothetical protein